ncbi:MAG: hypothetical protein Q8N38_08870 [Bacteroidales bacterium]|nr:hypothetical protein [Bacteroidales bacterium]
MNKFWNYESGEVKIDEQCLYDSLFLKGFRCFKPTNDNFKYIVIFIDNTVDIYFENKLWRFCCWLIDKEFKSVAEEERTHVKEALIKCKETLKNENLTQLKIEDLEKCGENESKKFLQRLITKSGVEKGSAYGL